VRIASLAVLLVWLCLAITALAQEAPGGPALQPADVSPEICDPTAPGFRYLEVRGTGFDAWASQHLVGTLLDASGVPHEQWSSIWVSPQGDLTLELNLCADPYQNHAALPAGDYTVAVGQGNSAPLATTGISLSQPPEPGDEGEAPAVTAPTTPAQSSTLLTPTPFTYFIPTVQAQAVPTPLPIATLSAST
jgi:hypothetical protein